MKYKWWKNPKIIGTAGYYAFLCWGKTMRIKVQKHISIDPKQAYIFIFWHGSQFLPSLVLHRHHFSPMCVMVSPSHDGSLLSTYLSKYGYEVIRGSSRANNVAALIQLRKKILKGISVGTAIDGPIGPIHQVKPGLIYLAQKYNIPIIPMGSAYARSWIFSRAWDKFKMPKPFSKAALVLGQPYIVKDHMDVEQACIELANELHATELAATELIS